MKNELNISLLKKEFGRRKKIPSKYEKEILIALSYYPELKDIKIKFQLVRHAKMPYGTKPSFFSFMRSKKNRTYTITILESSSHPEKEALFTNLTEDMRISVMGHELAHVFQFSECDRIGLLKKLSSFLVHRTRRRIERGADLLAIKHGLGEGLLKHARYIRSIPGYLEKRPEINEEYLKPAEIAYFIKHPNKITKVS